MNFLPEHGLINCSECFPSEQNTQRSGNWTMCNDPGAWGGTNPKVLVLGFSKGFTQANMMRTGDFDSIAFAKMRPKLKQALITLGVVDNNHNIDDLFRRESKDIAFGSLVRCSLSRKDEKTGNWLATGTLITKAFNEEPAHTWVRSCMKKHLTNLPRRTKIIVLLSNTTSYVKLVKNELRELYSGDYTELNDVACKAGGITWVHSAHPSGLNGHFGTWLEGDPSTTAGLKCKQAQDAIRQAVT